MERLYHLFAINDKTKKKYQLTLYPMTHNRCLVMKAKQSKGVRIVFEEAVPTITEELAQALEGTLCHDCLFAGGVNCCSRDQMEAFHKYKKTMLDNPTNTR